MIDGQLYDSPHDSALEVHMGMYDCCCELDWEDRHYWLSSGLLTSIGTLEHQPAFFSLVE